MNESATSSFWRIIGNAPPLIITGCTVLACAAIAILLLLAIQTVKAVRNMRRFRDQLKFPEARLGRMRSGLTLEEVDALRLKFEPAGGLPLYWWQNLESGIESYTNAEENEGWFLTDRPAASLSYESVVGRQVNLPFYAAIPGVLTAAGLTLTFLAILLGLMGVHYDKSNTVNPITGIDILINGLSGKFLSSILALVLSIFYTLIERSTSRFLANGYANFVQTISANIPHLTQARILLDIQRYSAKQTVSISNISSEVVDRFTSAFNERVTPGLTEGMSAGVAATLEHEFRPTFDRMATALDSLQASLLGIESAKNESVTGEFEKLAKGIESSITNALSGLAENFHEALSGSAKAEFGNVQGTLESTRQMLAEMNTQFGQMQGAFQQILENAGQSTSDQLLAGRKQTEALAELMNGLMLKLQETADQNLNSMQNHLTRVVADLSEKVGSLSTEMMSAANEVTSRSQQSASQILEKTDQWTEDSAKRLEKLLDNIESRSADFKEAATSLLEAKQFLSSLLTANAAAVSQMAEASRNVQMYSNGLAGHVDSMRSVGSNQLAVANQFRASAESVSSTVAQQKLLLEDYLSAAQDFKEVLDSLDENLAKIMTATSKGLADYNAAIENNFTKVVDIADKLVPEAANLLHSQIESLGDQLEDLGDTLNLSIDRLNGRKI